MGWKGAIRSVAAAARAAERDAQYRHKQQLKAQIIADSVSAVDDWENYIHDLVSIHADQADKVDWQNIANQPKPEQPFLTTTHQDRAEITLAEFKPGIRHIFRGGSAKVHARLKNQSELAGSRDRQEYDDAVIAHAEALKEWKEDTTLAARLLRGEAAAIQQVMQEAKSLSETALIGTEVRCVIAKGFIQATLQVHGDDIVPSTRRKQLASGRLSETKMPVGQFNELYQDYVCSAALKLAGDMFHILPLDEVYVTCTANMLNAQTGHQEWMPILSVQFVRASFERLNHFSLDPSDSMRNFRHAMKFSKTKGFAAIEPL